MKLPQHFRITLTGTIEEFRSREVVQEGFSHPFANILCGADIPPDLFRAWGLTIAVEENIEDGLKDTEMCNLYRLKTGTEEMAALFNARVTKPVEWKPERSEEHTSELQSLMRNSYDVFCLKNKKITQQHT